MLSRISTVAFQGVETTTVEVQVQLSPGLPSFTIVGLADKAVAESRERVRAALFTLGLSLPPKKITVNLAPADLAKEGSHFDVPIALAILMSMGVVGSDAFEGFDALGELALDGSLQPVAGVLPAALHASANERGLICPEPCGAEARWAGEIDILAAPNLLSLIQHAKGEVVLSAPEAAQVEHMPPKVDMSMVRGQPVARRALEVAAAGGHNLLMSGPPGVGKSLLASCLPGILPPLTPQEMLEVSMIYSVAGMLPEGGLSTQRPFRDPHHSSSMAAMVGGGKRAVPGEISLAHRGVLFLDELPEFQRGVLESLRQPMETGNVTIARVAVHVNYPARFQLVAAMNPCRCGYIDDASRACNKAPRCGEDYQGKISGPMLDRMDLHLTIPAVETAEMLQTEAGEASAVVAKRVACARDAQAARAKANGLDALTNAELSGENLEQICALSDDANALMKQALEQLKLSMRAYTRTLRVARTIADLDGKDAVGREHLAEALGYRFSK